MTDPRYGQPGGFGGAYDEPTKGEFQPGTETGVTDPNEGRFGAKIYDARVRPAGDIYVALVRAAAIIHDAIVEPAAGLTTAAVRPV